MPILSNFPGGAGSGSGGLTLAAVSGITTQVSSGKVYVKWTDPDDLVVAGSTIAAWGGTLLVRKAGSAPTSRRDGTIVLDSKTRNAYKNTYFCDSGLSNGTKYYYKFFPYTTANAYTDSTDDEFNAIPTVQVAGITSWNVTGMSASSEAGNGKMTVKWTDPSASISADGVTLASWASTTIVVKSGSYPTSKDDSGAVYTLKVTTRNQYSSTPLTITGLTNGTKYYIAFFPETTDGGINTSTSQRTTGTANRITIANVPAQSGTLTYNKSSQSPSWRNYNTTYMTISGTTSGTNAGNYTASFTPKTDYRWSDGATTAKNVVWSIGKATGTLTVSKTTIKLMSVLKAHRSESKAEFVNVANKIYIQTIAFLSRLSSRYSRLVSKSVSELASEVVDHAEKANSIYPSDAARKELRKQHLLEARASLMALDVHLAHCYDLMMTNPSGCFTTGSGNSVGASDAKKKLEHMAQELGDLIDAENGLLTNVLKSDKSR